ncbi:hypothetical protein LFT45_23145 (plasmid) [Arthrobacter sp. FW305-BF8]|uniref:hypothetical protein n=1 Tax=Arthrobacter sp. FW305-BF8 TaxID=2879617 RepID=UPI001F3479B2|nr:hypothetical protein [Arthrobacter sp. FW305-BF8]UKA56774.1 hypothetical protein LFT45_23145 [Arthrobacter sp. FW305-BF8]
MRYTNEGQIKQELGIESWRNLSKAKMIKFAMMMPDMDAELALKIVEQFPVFADFATGVVGAMKKMHKTTLFANKESQDRFHESCQQTRDIIQRQLNQDGLSFEERKYYLEQIMEILKLESQKDSENKQFLHAGLKNMLGFAMAGIAFGVVVLGGKATIERKDSPEGKDSTESFLES